MNQAIEPITFEPTAIEPTAIESTAIEPTAIESTAIESTAIEPTAIEPTAMEAPGTKMLMQPGWGGMAVAYWEMPATDSAPMLKGLPNDSCPCTHWGYMIKGSLHIKYDDGTEETVSAGDVFYLPAGHNGKSDEELVWIEFSPEKELKQVLDHIAKK